MLAQFAHLAKLAQLAQFRQIHFKLQIEILLLKVINWYIIILLSLGIKLPRGLKNTTMQSYVAVRGSLKITTDS